MVNEEFCCLSIWRRQNNSLSFIQAKHELQIGSCKMQLVGGIHFIKSFLPYIERAVKEKNLDPQYYTMTIDKIAVLENKPQIYGTEYTMEGGQKKYYPIIDIDNINKRRRSNGLGIFNKSYNIYDTVILGKKYR